MAKAVKLDNASVLHSEADEQCENLRVALEEAQDKVTQLISESAALNRVKQRLEARVCVIDARLRESEGRNLLRERTKVEVDRLGASVRLYVDALQASQRELEESFERVADARKALEVERERSRITLHCLHEGVITTDAMGMVNYLNPIAEQLTGWTFDDAKGEHISSVLRLCIEGNGAPLSPDLWHQCTAEDRLIQSGDHCELASRDGTVIAIAYSAVPICLQNGERLGIAVSMSDVSQSRLAARQIAHDASHDSLTGLVNRREFERRLAQALASAESHHALHIFAYMDLDNFKIVNDVAGHDAGDRLLQQLKTNVASSIRERDTFARLGGDEFALLLENCALDDGVRICEAILACLRQSPLVWEDRTFAVAASIGVVTLAGSGSTPAELLIRGDMACYTAKERGGDQVFVLEGDDMSSRRHQDISRVSVLRNALDRDRLRLYFQPIVPLHDESGQTAGIEVLLRCLDASDDLMLPSTLIPAAERYGLMRAVDRWVIERACQFVADIRRRVSSTANSLGHLAINLSGSSVDDETLPAFLRQQFATYDVPPDHFCFEITETCAIHNLGQAAAFVRELQGIGCSVALDDFGSGLSSFTYLKALPVNYVKIDGGFVKDMLKNPVDHAVVVAINDIAAMMGVRSIAEYVHSLELLHCLRELSVDYAQGNAIGVASPLDDFDWTHLEGGRRLAGAAGPA